MRPSRVLLIYCTMAFVIGLILTLLITYFLARHEIGVRGAAVMTVCWNVLFVLILPLVLDWSESKYFKARFFKLEEIYASNPELAAMISQQCQKLSIHKLRLAVVESKAKEVFSYGLLGGNPRLMLSSIIFQAKEKKQILPSIETQLAYVKWQGHTWIFIMFTAIQIILPHIILMLYHR